MNDTVPVRVTIECQGRRGVSDGVWRVYPYGETPGTNGLVLDTTADSITVEDLTPPREWREHDVVQVWLDDPWGPPATLVRGAHTWWRGAINGYHDDEVTAAVERQEPLRGRAVTDVLVLRHQAGEGVRIPYADAAERAAS